MSGLPWTSPIGCGWPCGCLRRGSLSWRAVWGSSSCATWSSWALSSVFVQPATCGGGRGLEPLVVASYAQSSHRLQQHLPKLQRLRRWQWARHSGVPSGTTGADLPALRCFRTWFPFRGSRCSRRRPESLCPKWTIKLLCTGFEKLLNNLIAHLELIYPTSQKTILHTFKWKIIVIIAKNYIKVNSKQ